MKLRSLCLSIVLAAAPPPLISEPALVRPGRGTALPPNEVKDSFFAYVFGVIKARVEIDLGNSDLRDILTEFKSNLNLPFDLVDRVRQYGGPNGSEVLSIQFSKPFKVPIPFSFLGYHPGSILASPLVRFTETRPVATNPLDPNASRPVYVMRLTEGTVMVDVDDWLEALLPTLVDDTFVETVAIFKWANEWLCLLAGTGSRKEPVRQFFNLTRNVIVFPIPKDLAALAERIVKADSVSF